MTSSQILTSELPGQLMSKTEQNRNQILQNSSEEAAVLQPRDVGGVKGERSPPPPPPPPPPPLLLPPAARLSLTPPGAAPGLAAEPGRGDACARCAVAAGGSAGRPRAGERGHGAAAAGVSAAAAEGDDRRAGAERRAQPAVLPGLHRPAAVPEGAHRRLVRTELRNAGWGGARARGGQSARG